MVRVDAAVSTYYLQRPTCSLTPGGPLSSDDPESPRGPPSLSHSSAIVRFSSPRVHLINDYEM